MAVNRFSDSCTGDNNRRPTVPPISSLADTRIRRQAEILVGYYYKYKAFIPDFGLTGAELLAAARLAIDMLEADTG